MSLSQMELFRSQIPTELISFFKSNHRLPSSSSFHQSERELAYSVNSLKQKFAKNRLTEEDIQKLMEYFPDFFKATVTCFSRRKYGAIFK
jgi:hypothetical protein